MPWLASGAEVRGAAGADWIAPDTAVLVQFETDLGVARKVAASLALPDGWTAYDRTASDGGLRVEAMPTPLPSNGTRWPRPPPRST